MSGNTIRCECGDAVEKSRNGLSKYCPKCKAKYKKIRESARVTTKECKKCHGTFEGHRRRTVCYVCNPVTRSSLITPETISGLSYRACIKCGLNKPMNHGNQRVCNDCKPKDANSHNGGASPVRREISNVDFSAFDKFN